ncbi:MAG: hypothetical protein R3263_02490 [Myxococcota bacterium]|nr:hypothetical protein [Myxococcota bacterium]
MRKQTKLPHRNRRRSVRHRAKRKNKLERRRKRQSSGQRKFYR